MTNGIKETKGSFFVFGAESSYAGGITTATTADYAMVIAATTGGSPADIPHGKVTFPKENPLKEPYHPNNLGALSRLILDKGIEYIDGSIGLHTQQVQQLQWALYKMGASTVADQGDVLQSYWVHHYNGFTHFEKYGLQTKEYVLECKSKDWLYQTITPIHYRTKWDTDSVTASRPNAVTMQNYLDKTASPPLYYGNISAMIDSVDYVIKDMKLDIKNHMDEEDNDSNQYINNNYRLKPRLKSRDLDLDITFRLGDSTSTDSVMKPYIGNPYDPSTVVLTLPFAAATKTLTLTNMLWKTYNDHELAEYGFHEYTAHLELAEGATITLA